MAELANTASLEWRPAVDNLLLLWSIALAYIAGIITPAGDGTFTGNGRQENASETTSTTFEEFGKQQHVNHGSAKHVPFNLEDVWNGVHTKLLSSYFSLDNEDILQSPVLSLEAIAKGPRLRLLSTTLDQLHKEVDKLREGSNLFASSWIELSSTLICQITLPICRRWLAEEHSFEKQNPSSANLSRASVTVSDSILHGEWNSEPANAAEEGTFSAWNSFLNSQLESLQGTNVMADFLARSGKQEFYTDFLQFICFGSVRPGSCCKIKEFSKHAEAILEDLVVVLADGVAVIYLDLLSADNVQLDLPSVTLPAISSTRALERFRNEVAIQGWLYENFESVTAMFEDYFDLWTLKERNFKKSRQAHSGQFRWLRNDGSRQMADEAEASELVLNRVELPAKRTRELRGLSGWRYYYSLYLEFSDVVGPLLRTLISKLGEGLSFLLVCFIGRSLGLIYKGIRQSIGWTSGC